MAPACAGLPVNTFYDPKKRKEALKTCAGCPVRLLCLNEELRRPQVDQHGIRGGMTARRRKLVLRERRNAGSTVSSPARVIKLSPTVTTATSPALKAGVAA